MKVVNGWINRVTWKGITFEVEVSCYVDDCKLITRKFKMEILSEARKFCKSVWNCGGHHRLADLSGELVRLALKNATGYPLIAVGNINKDEFYPCNMYGKKIIPSKIYTEEQLTKLIVT